MRRRLLGFCFLIAFWALFSANPVKADDMFTYTLDGDTYTWTLPSSPDTTLPNNMATNGNFFELGNICYSLNDGPQICSVTVGQKVESINIDFFNVSQGGGFQLLGTPLNEFGDQLYTGPMGGEESMPTFLPGTYTLAHNNDSEDPGTLTIEDLTAVPEPGTLLLLGTGVLSLLGFVRKKVNL